MAACAVVGVPVITPVDGVILRPAGRDADQVMVLPKPVTIGAVVAVIAEPTVPTTGVIDAITPWMVTVTLVLAVAPAPVVAVTR